MTGKARGKEEEEKEEGEYTERLNKLNLTTLVCRRARSDMLETFT